VPFVLTVAAILLTDLLVGVLIGLAVSLGFILNSNLRRPIRRFVEKHLGGDVLHIELANQVSFLNRAALLKVLDAVPRGGHVLLDAQNTDYIDPDVLDLLRDFTEQSAPARGVEVSLLGFRIKYQLQDRTQYVDYSTRELQSRLTPQQVLQILKDGHERFRTGQRLTRDLGRQIGATSGGQHPLAVVLSCIDSRTPTELIFDLGLGDIFSIRIAGNIISREVLGSMEYACAVAGAKLILVMGHTRCGAVTAAVELTCSAETPGQATGCEHLEPIVDVIQQSVDPLTCQRLEQLSAVELETFVNAVARGNVSNVTEMVFRQSHTLGRLHQEGRVAIIGAIYDVVTGEIEFVPHADACVVAPSPSPSQT
jgi:carbonic anhydrase/SulP family sulfate permease